MKVNISEIACRIHRDTSVSGIILTNRTDNGSRIWADMKVLLRMQPYQADVACSIEEYTYDC
jgi:hypothetical protein